LIYLSTLSGKTLPLNGNYFPPLVATLPLLVLRKKDKKRTEKNPALGSAGLSLRQDNRNKLFSP
jgi:hypothetical protein